MKNIEPIQVWKDGVVYTATELHAQSNLDNLRSTASFYYWLTTTTTEEQQGVMVTQGNINMTPEDYDAWDNSNEWAFQYIAEQINVTIVK